MVNEVLLIDFHDSFTHNIASCLLQMNLQTKIVSVDSCEKSIQEFIGKKRKSIIVMGPGPGHPQEYHCIQKEIEKILNCEHIFLMGICLGHQLLLSHLGGEIVTSRAPMHGRREKLIIPEWNNWFPSHVIGKEMLAQRYNSLCVTCPSDDNDYEYWYNENRELMGSLGQRFVSFQFHPESVGTSYQKYLFSPLLNFLYNSINEYSTKN